MQPNRPVQVILWSLLIGIGLAMLTLNWPAAAQNATPTNRVTNTKGFNGGALTQIVLTANASGQIQERTATAFAATSIHYDAFRATLGASNGFQYPTQVPLPTLQPTVTARLDGVAQGSSLWLVGIGLALAVMLIYNFFNRRRKRDLPETPPSGAGCWRSFTLITFGLLLLPICAMIITLLTVPTQVNRIDLQSFGFQTQAALMDQTNVAVELLITQTEAKINGVALNWTPTAQQTLAPTATPLVFRTDLDRLAGIATAQVGWFVLIGLGMVVAGGLTWRRFMRT